MNATLDKWTKEFSKHEHARQTKLFFPKPNNTRSHELINMTSTKCLATSCCMKINKLLSMIQSYSKLTSKDQSVKMKHYLSVDFRQFGIYN